jgi:nucleoside-diphosphate-sugar epimerase
MKTVGIIGGSGFIGSYNTLKFLQEGYRVRVSTTDISKKDKYEHLLQWEHAGHLEVVQMDVENKAELESFLKGCHVVVHGGTPFQLDVQDPKSELFDPTIKGTENFLEAVQKTPGIEKVIFIASIASYNTNFPLPPGNMQETDQFDENNVPFMSDQSHPYAQAKFIANEVVNKFVAEHPDPGFEICSVSPVGVMGRSLSTRQDSTSTGLQFLFKNKIAPNPFIQMFYDNNIYFAIVDVADVAEGVFKAAITPGNHGKNYLLTSESWTISDISLMLNHELPTGQALMFYRNDLATNELGMTFKPAMVSLNEYSL